LIRLVLVAPSPAVRAGLQSMLTLDAGLLINALAPSLTDLLPGAAVPFPKGSDLLIVVAEAFDPELLSHILEPLDSPPALLLLSDDGRQAADLADLPLNAWGLLSLAVGEHELLAAVHALYEGLLVAEPSLFEPLVEQRVSVSGLEEDLVDALTTREVEVLQLLAHGLANKQIASQLGISPHTVKFHLSSIYSKLDAANRAEAVSLGARRGLIAL